MYVAFSSLSIATQFLVLLHSFPRRTQLPPLGSAPSHLLDVLFCLFLQEFSTHWCPRSVPLAPCPIHLPDTPFVSFRCRLPEVGPCLYCSYHIPTAHLDIPRKISKLDMLGQTLVQALMRLRQNDRKFEISLNDTEKFCFKTNKEMPLKINKYLWGHYRIHEWRDTWLPTTALLIKHLSWGGCFA